MASSAQETVTIENDDDGDEVVLVQVNTGVVDLTSDVSSDEADYQKPTVSSVPKPKIEARKTQRNDNKKNRTAELPNQIRHTIINIGNCVVPFIFRGEKQLTEKNIVEELLFFKYFRIFSDELIQCMTPVLFTPNDGERIYFINLHKQFKCSGAISNILFVKEDVEKMLEFLTNCYDMLVLRVPKFSICGFVKVLGTLIPFIMHNWFKFMPLFYFENDSDLGQRLAKVSATFSNPWVLSYLKLCCKIEGVREEFYLKSFLKLVNLNSLVKHLPDGTRVDIYWPDKFIDILFRPEYLKNTIKAIRKCKPPIPKVNTDSKKRERKQSSAQTKKSKPQPTIEQTSTESNVNDIKVTIENVMTIPDDDFDDEDSEFTESSKNQNVIVIRANDTVPIQMSLNVGPVNSSQTNANLDKVLASHNQGVFNQNLRSEVKAELEDEDEKKITSLTTEGIKKQPSKRNDDVVSRTFEHLTKLQQEFKANQTVESKPIILNSSVATTCMLPDFTIRTEKSVEITMDDICKEDDDDEGALVIAEQPSPSTSVVSVASSKDPTDFEQSIPTVTVQPPQKKTVPKLRAIAPAKSVRKENSKSSKAKQNKSTFSSPVVSNTEVKPYPVCLMGDPRNTLVPLILKPSIGGNLTFNLPSENVDTTQQVAFSLPIQVVNTNKPPDDEIVMPKIVNSYSVVEEVQQPSFVCVKGTRGATPPPVMVINKDHAQSVLYRVTQLEDDASSLLEGNYLVRQVVLDGKKFHCINVNPGKFTNWLISVSEIEGKLFDARTATQDLIKNFFQAGMELFRLNNNQKLTYQLFKDPNLIKHIQGLYIDYDEFQNMFDNIRAGTSR